MKILLTNQLEYNLFNIGNSVAETDTAKDALLNLGIIGANMLASNIKKQFLVWSQKK